MKWSRSDKNSDADVLAEDAPDEAAAEEHAVTLAKGRPTPKRRESQGKRGPVRAPQTRKEAIARQRQLAKDERAAKATARPRTVAEQRAALRRGDPDALPRRDQGATRKLARDYVDSKRMLSNYLLWLFPLFVLTSFVPALRGAEILVLVLFLVLVGEWFVVGKRIRALARERTGKADGSNMSIGFYAGSRAYLPRRWRLPAPQVERGDAF